MATHEYDIVILGGGTGGYIAAIRAAQLGKSVAIVEKDQLGGTCLHKGCIPSKSLLRSAEVYSMMKDSEAYGVVTTGVELDFELVQKRKQRIVEQLHQGVQMLMKKNKIDVYIGQGRVIGPSIFSPRSGAIAIESPEETENDDEGLALVSKNLIIATGSKPRQIPGLEADGEAILTSDEALNLKQPPKSIIIVGGGVIGIEWASMLSDFGTEVTLVEAEDQILPQEDQAVSREMKRLLKKRNVQVMTSVRILPESKQLTDQGITIKAEHKGEEIELTAEKLLVSVGRQANSEHIGLENTDVQTERGFIKVNKFMQTTESHIYAIGDVNNGSLQLAHVAGHQGVMAVDHASGLKIEAFAEERVPRCIYTRPEIASIGWSESKAKELGFDVHAAQVSFKAIGKAWIYGDSDGFVKVVKDQKTDDILGVHMIGPHVTDYIAEAALAQLLEASPWEVSQVIHPHPTLSEVIGEAMLAVDGKAIGI